jgi:hypothetical protein
LAHGCEAITTLVRDVAMRLRDELDAENVAPPVCA